MVNCVLSGYYLVLEHKGHVGKSHVSKKKGGKKRKFLCIHIIIWESRYNKINTTILMILKLLLHNNIDCQQK